MRIIFPPDPPDRAPAEYYGPLKNLVNYCTTDAVVTRDLYADLRRLGIIPWYRALWWRIRYGRDWFMKSSRRL